MKFQRSLKPNVNIDLVPMIDVVFQLVVFFMVTSTFTIGPGLSLALPEAETSDSVVMTQLQVTIAGPEDIYLNDQKYDIESFSQAVAALNSQESDTIVVEASKTVSYELFIDVVDMLRKAGIYNYTLKTRVEEVE